MGYENLCSWCRSWQECLQRRRARRVGRGRFAAAGEARDVDRVSRQATPVRRGDGGLLRGAHHLGRVFAAHGHEVRLMSPEYVRPYIKAQKNDDRDTEGIADAATRP